MALIFENQIFSIIFFDDLSYFYLDYYFLLDSL